MISRAKREPAALMCDVCACKTVALVLLHWTMASQPAPGSLEVAEISSFIRGFRVYKDAWQPVVGKMLITRKEPTNVKGRAGFLCPERTEGCGTCAMKSGSVVFRK